MVIEAKEELIFASQEKVSIESPNQIMMTTPLSGISMENEMHFNGMNTIIECTDETEFSPVKQEKQVEEPGYIVRIDRRKKPDFFVNWLNLMPATTGMISRQNIGNETARSADEITRMRDNAMIGSTGMNKTTGNIKLPHLTGFNIMDSGIPRERPLGDGCVVVTDDTGPSESWDKKQTKLDEEMLNSVRIIKFAVGGVGAFATLGKTLKIQIGGTVGIGAILDATENADLFTICQNGIKNAILAAFGGNFVTGAMRSAAYSSMTTVDDFIGHYSEGLIKVKGLLEPMNPDKPQDGIEINVEKEPSDNIQKYLLMKNNKKE